VLTVAYWRAAEPKPTGPERVERAATETFRRGRLRLYASPARCYDARSPDITSCIINELPTLRQRGSVRVRAAVRVVRADRGDQSRPAC